MTTTNSDQEIQRAVEGELLRDSRLHAADIAVTVDDRVVILTGTACSWGEKAVAQQIAHRVRAVRDVVNDVEVAHAKPLFSDTEIAHAVRSALRTSSVPHERISTTVSAGVVNLEGTVDSIRDRDLAEVTVRELDGVRTVLNTIEVAERRLDPLPRALQ